MNITTRYNPVSQRFTIREFGNKFFRAFDEINFDKVNPTKDKIRYPIGWDDKHDRGIVWSTTNGQMPEGFISGIEHYTNNNPINIIDLKSNIKTLDFVKEKDDIKYWQSFVDNGYDYFVFIGKNRTLTSIYKIWKSLLMGETTYDYLDNENYVIEVKIFDRNFDNKWKGEFYRGEKTQYADTLIMMYVSYDCNINDTIYSICTDLHKKRILNYIYDKDAVTQYKDRWWIFKNMWYLQTKKWKDDAKKMEAMWRNNDDVPDNFNTLFGKLLDYIKYVNNTYATFSNKSKIKKDLLGDNFLKVAWMVLIELYKSNHSINIDKKNDDIFKVIVEYFISKISDKKTIYGWTEKERLLWMDLKKGLSYDRPVFKDADRLIVGDDQLTLMLKSLQTELINNILVKEGIIIKKEKRKSFTSEDQLILFEKNSGYIRVNGCKEKSDGSIEWFSSKNEPLYKEYTLQEFMQEATNIDHIDAIARSGTNNFDNLELATKDFNSWKGADKLIQ
jgi:hypothetical protein